MMVHTFRMFVNSDRKTNTHISFVEYLWDRLAQGWAKAEIRLRQLSGVCDMNNVCFVLGALKGYCDFNLTTLKLIKDIFD